MARMAESSFTVPPSDRPDAGSRSDSGSQCGVSRVDAASGRLVSLDAFRGAIMLLMASSGLGLAEVFRHFPESRLWAVLGAQSEHASWVGCRAWDLIQPAFMFMVGVALPWSLASRRCLLYTSPSPRD